MRRVLRYGVAEHSPQLALHGAFGIEGSLCIPVCGGIRVHLGDGGNAVAYAIARGVLEVHVDGVGAVLAAVIADRAPCGWVPTGRARFARGDGEVLFRGLALRGGCEETADAFRG